MEKEVNKFLSSNDKIDFQEPLSDADILRQVVNENDSENEILEKSELLVRIPHTRVVSALNEYLYHKSERDINFGCSDYRGPSIVGKPCIMYFIFKERLVLLFF